MSEREKNQLDGHIINMASPTRMSGNEEEGEREGERGERRRGREGESERGRGSERETEK